MSNEKEYKDFESAMARLEEITTALEEGELTLEQSIALYKEGITIAAVCDTKLREAEGQIAQLSRVAEKFSLDSFKERTDG